MSDFADWNKQVFERARLQRQQEFDKILRNNKREEPVECQPSLFTSSADSASNPSDSSKGQV